MLAIESGVAQGCPAGGSAWAIAMDPIIRHIALITAHVDPGCDPRSNYLGACADDIGILCGSFGIVSRVDEPFDAAARLALLSLKPRRCVVVPLWDAATPATIAQTQALLSEFSPAWSGISVSGRAA
eukprot:7666389-Pyramimonas_sp.AAC.1